MIKRRHRWCIQTRQHADYFFHFIFGDIHFDAHHFFTAQRPFEQKCNLFYFGAFGFIFPGIGVGNQLGIGLHELVNHAQTVGLNCGFRFRDLHDCIRKSGHHLGLSCTP